MTECGKLFLGTIITCPCLSVQVMRYLIHLEPLGWGVPRLAASLRPEPGFPRVYRQASYKKMARESQNLLVSKAA